jgi:hypothetical protein
MDARFVESAWVDTWLVGLTLQARMKQSLD